MTGADPGAVELLEPGVCFDPPPNIPHFFLVRVENKMHIVYIACWLQLKYVRVMQSKFTKNKPNFFSNRRGGGGGVAPVLDPPLYDVGLI